MATRVGTVVGQGDIVRFERVKKKWSRAQLADVAEVSESTIKKIENGIPVFPDKLAAVAQSLNLPIDLIKKPAIGPGFLRMRIEVELDAFNPPEWLKAFMQAIETSNHINMVELKRGSVFLTIEIDADDIKKRCRSFLDGDLDALAVSDLEIMSLSALTLEQHILYMMLRGKSTSAIAERLNRMEKTVERHKFNILQRHAVSDVSELARLLLPSARQNHGV